MTTEKNPCWIVYLSTFPPLQCGIASFMQNLIQGFDSLFSEFVVSKIIAINPDSVSNFYYPSSVIFQVDKNNPKHFALAAKKINRLPQVKLVVIQHEFGLFGGVYRDNLKYFLKALKKPVVTILHTVLPRPPKRMKKVMAYILKKSAVAVVMTPLSKKILETDYRHKKENIQIIPHGIHQVEYSDNRKYKNSLGFKNKILISTFGLLGPSKGLEYVLRALPPVVKKFPQVRYLILGVTHPEIVKRKGEKYRNFLVKKINNLGLENYVSFYNKYFEYKELLNFLKATDIYISGSLNPNQAVSGTLSYALGIGRPVISTAFAQARQDVTKEVGLLVDFKKPKQYTQALLKLLSDDKLRDKLGINAYFRTRHMTWRNVALSYMKIYSQIVPKLAVKDRHLPNIKLTHLARLTDNIGIFQFAQLHTPNPAYGYTLDDNARALLATATYFNKIGKPNALKLAKTYLKFIETSLTKKGAFHNYFNRNKSLNLEANSKDSLEDANARTLYVLAKTLTFKKLPQYIKNKIYLIYQKGSQTPLEFNHPRSIAFCIIGLCHLYQLKKNARLKSLIHRYCKKLTAMYRLNRSPKWEWFEEKLTYSNSILSEALLEGFRATGKNEYYLTGKKTLDFLINKTFCKDYYVSIGQNGWYTKFGQRAYYDQQPEDTAAMVQTLKKMYLLSGCKKYQRLMYRAFYWFLGENSLGQVVYDCLTGGCYDGLGEHHVNLNQGAESTISYLLARLSLEPDSL